MIRIQINGTEILAEQDDTILTAAEKNNIDIPTLCYMKGVIPSAVCRMCLVEVEGYRTLLPACSTPVQENMVIWTDNERVRNSRRRTLDLLASHHRMACDTCVRYSDCEFHDLCTKYGIHERDYNPYQIQENKDLSAAHLIRDTSKCILCQRCLQACDRQGMHILDAFGRGVTKQIRPAKPLAETECIGCGQCISVCPTGALEIQDTTVMARNLIRQQKKFVVAVLSPTVGKSIGTLFYDKTPAERTGKAIAMARRLGFQQVFNGAELEPLFLESECRQASGAKNISSFCPAVVTFLHNSGSSGEEHLIGDQIFPQFLASIVSKACAEKFEISQSNILVVYVSTCTAGKLYQSDGLISMTVYEFAAMFRRACISNFTAQQVWREAEPEEFDVLPVSEAEKLLEPLRIYGIPNLRNIQTSSEYVLAFACPGGCLQGGGGPRICGYVPGTKIGKE